MGKPKKDASTKKCLKILKNGKIRKEARRTRLIPTEDVRVEANNKVMVWLESSSRFQKCAQPKMEVNTDVKMGNGANNVILGSSKLTTRQLASNNGGLEFGLTGVDDEPIASFSTDLFIPHQEKMPPCSCDVANMNDFEED